MFNFLLNCILWTSYIIELSLEYIIKNKNDLLSHNIKYKNTDYVINIGIFIYIKKTVQDNKSIRSVIV